MLHLGDITKISGYTAPIVDCIIGGSPCQDLSVAGKRVGLEGERSGLFMEQIRIVKEMRERDKRTGRAAVDVRPRYMVWENVPGAFSSGKPKGGDFAAVLEEIIRIAEPEAPPVPIPEKGWPTAGCIYDEMGNWSVAWRILDAQFFGTPSKSLPQRRRRIALVADFGGLSAPEILFVRKSMSGDIEPGEPKRKRTARTAEDCSGAADFTCLVGALNCMHDQQAIVLDRAFYNQGVNAQYDPQLYTDGTCPTLVAKGPSAVCYAMQGFGDYKQSEVGSGLKARDYKDATDLVVTPTEIQYIVRRLTPTECERLQGFPSEKKWDVSKMTKDEYIAWNLAEGNILVDAEKGIVYGTRGPGGVPYKEPKPLKGSEVNGYKVVSIRNGATKLQCRVHRIVWISQNGIIPEGYCIDHINNDKQDNRISNLQLLTPAQNSTKAKEDGLYMEGLDNKATKLDPDLRDELCYLYQFSDFTQRELAEVYGISKSRVNQLVKEVGWTDIGEWVDSKGKKHKEADSPRYKALGNSIALPPWKWVLKRLCACYERDATMASLFSGIGGFDLLWTQLNGMGSVLWESEIDEFPSAVCKKHFGDEATGEKGDFYEFFN